MKKLAVRILKFLAITATAFVAILFLLPVLFPGKIAASIRQWANQSITGELNFSKARLSFFKHFPTLTLTLHDFSLKGSAPFEKDTLLSGDEMSFGLKLNSLFGSTIEVDEFYIHKALVQVLVDKKGKANYNIYRSTGKPPGQSGDTKSTDLKIKGIYFTDCRLKYHDQSHSHDHRGRRLQL
jgi:AsmA protein